jgi:glycosyltransferase involved in cell wall biosynthesis
MVEQLHLLGDDQIVVLADPGDHRTIIPKVGYPWDTFKYRFFSHDTSRQQALWVLFDRPGAEKFWPEAEVVYCTAESYVPARRARLAVTAHDAAFLENGVHRQDFSLRKQRAKWRYLYHKLSRRADRIMTVSQFSCERLGHFFPAIRDRLRVIPNGIPGRFFDPVSQEGEEALAAIGLAGRRFILVPCGLQHRKNADLVLRTWPLLREKHRDLLLVVASHCRLDYIERARALGPSVHLTGFVDDELMCSLYHTAGAVWFPSMYEGFGLPALEAMACGTPVVTANCSSLPEIAGDAALLVAPKSMQDHIDALDSLLRTPSLVERLVAAGRERAQMFTWQGAAAKLRSELQFLL